LRGAVQIAMPSSIAAEVFVLAAFPCSAAVLCRALARLPSESRKKNLLAAAIVISIAAKIALAGIGHNNDVGCYIDYNNLIAQGKNLYTAIDYYNYGPFWGWFVSGVGRLASPASGERFHMWIAAFLAVSDALTAVLLARFYSWPAAMVFLLSPVGFLISGYHSQIETVALLLGLTAWLQVRKGNPRPRALWTSAVCAGLSLAVKHILALFPMCLLFWRPLGRLRDRLLYAAAAYGVLVASFLPWLGDPVSRAGVVKHVLFYRSGTAWGTAWLPTVFTLALPASASAALLRIVHGPSGAEELWLVGLATATAVLAHKRFEHLFFLYLLLLFTTAPQVGPSYVVVPMLAAAVLWRCWESWMFVFFAGWAAFCNTDNVGMFVFRALPTLHVHGHSYYVADLMSGPATRLFLLTSQACAGALMIRLLRRRGSGVTPSETVRIRTRLGRVAAVAAAGGVPALVPWAQALIAHYHYGKVMIFPQ